MKRCCDEKKRKRKVDIEMPPMERCSNRRRRRNEIEMPSSSKYPIERCSKAYQNLNRESKNILLCFGSSVGSFKGFVCYSIDPSSSSSTEITNLTTPICTVPESVVGTAPGTIALGSKVYIIGQGSSDVFCFDIGDDSQPPFTYRKKRTHMLAKRYQPAVVATHGKIYVFGSSNTSNSTTYLHPWAEVFDPKSNTWSPLPDPDKGFMKKAGGSDLIRVALVSNGDTILLCVNDKMSCFDVINNCWTEFLPTPPSNRFLWFVRATPTAVDDLLFIYSVGCVNAYDLVEEKWYKVQGLGITPSPYIDDLLYGRVLHLGNKTLCVVRCEQRWMEKGMHVIVHCDKFRVTRVSNNNGDKVLMADVECRSSYQVDNVDFFSYCFPL